MRFVTGTYYARASRVAAALRRPIPDPHSGLTYEFAPDMALRLEKAFGVKMDTLMRMQSAYDIAQTRKREKLIRVRRVQPRADAWLERV